MITIYYTIKLSPDFPVYASDDSNCTIINIVKLSISLNEFKAYS